MSTTTLTASQRDLDDLLREPREALDLEVKEWLDLAAPDHRAALAKEMIALANHGGGFVVIGFAEAADGNFAAALPRPGDLTAWSQDAVQSIVARYIDPAIQCRVWHRAHPTTSELYPIIGVPGGHRIPVRAKAGSPDGKRLVPNRVYIRRAGPSSEEPRSMEEWDRFFERIVQNRQAELLDAMRSIMAGVLPGADTPPEPTLVDHLKAFAADADRRWRALVANLPEQAPARFPHGYYDVAFAIDAKFERKSLSVLNNIMRSSVRNHSGWPPFLTIGRSLYHPRPVDGGIECWIGPDTDGSFDRPAHHDYWRVTPAGFLFTRRGYPEDGRFNSEAAGATFDITTPTWKLGEAILEASYIAQALGAQDGHLLCVSEWRGLAGRQLVSHGNPNRSIMSGRSIAQADYEAVEFVPIASLPTALPELVFALLSPLYQLFDFFDLPKQLVDQELATLRKGNF